MHAHHAHLLAFILDTTTLLVIAVVACAVLGVVWFALRFWLASTRPANIQDIRTPSLDRLNRQALENLGAHKSGEPPALGESLEDDDPPPQLKQHHQHNP